MEIVFLETISLGDDINLDRFDELGHVTKYRDTPVELVPERVKDADVVVINKIQVRIVPPLSFLILSRNFQSLTERPGVLSAWERSENVWHPMHRNLAAMLFIIQHPGRTPISCMREWILKNC